MADVGAALGDAGLLKTDPRESSNTFADRLSGRQREAEPQMRFGLVWVARPLGAGVERNTGFGGRRDEFCDIDPVGEL